MALQLILTQDVPKLGKAGELVAVKPGYGRNYLLPQGLAVTATLRNQHQLEHNKRIIEKRIATQRAGAQELATRIGGMTLQFERVIGEGEKMFGSVTSRDISEQLKKAGIAVDHRAVKLDEAVKALGKYETTVRLDAGVIATLKFWVVGKEK
jgi:large subunit ribosomal protein L9